MGHISTSRHIKGWRRRDDPFEVFFDMILQFPGGPADVSLYFSKSPLHTLLFVPWSAASSLQGFFSPPPCSSASSGSRWCTVALLSLRRLQTSLIVPGSREIRLHSKAELAFPPPPVIRRQVATVTSSLQKFPSTAPLQIPVCSTSPFHVWKATTSPAVFFVKLSRESKPSLFLNFSHCIYIYIYFFSRNQKQLWSSVQGKFSSSPLSLCESSASTASKRKFRFWIREETALRHHRLPWFRLLLN